MNQYRNIDNIETNIKPDNLQIVEEIIQRSGFENKDTTRLSSGMLFVYPVPANMVAANEYKGLYALAPYLIGTIILEESPSTDPRLKRWIHLIFNDGNVEERRTPPFQWKPTPQNQPCINHTPDTWGCCENCGDVV